MVMEHMEGADFDGYLRAHGRLSPRATARLVFHVGAALEAAHSIGIVHRDVKAENIFVLGHGVNLVAKLFDFGIAKVPFRSHRTRMGTLIGTPAYMSPEQLASAKDVDRRADLWSLAVVAYLALTDAFPFEGESFGAVCAAIHKGAYTPVTRLASGLPEGTDEWFARALHRDIRARFDSADELCRSFGAVVGLTGLEALDGTSRPAPVELGLEGRPSVSGLSRTRRFGREPRKATAIVLAIACASAVTLCGWRGPGLAWLQRWASKSATASTVSSESDGVAFGGMSRTVAPPSIPAAPACHAPGPVAVGLEDQDASGAERAPTATGREAGASPHRSPRHGHAKRRDAGLDSPAFSVPASPIGVDRVMEATATDAGDSEDAPGTRLNAEFGSRE